MYEVLGVQMSSDKKQVKLVVYDKRYDSTVCYYLMDATGQANVESDLMMIVDKPWLYDDKRWVFCDTPYAEDGRRGLKEMLEGGWHDID